VFGFKRTTYTVPDRGAFRASWWQFGERILRFREQRVG
jgi:hypothetical protein